MLYDRRPAVEAAIEAAGGAGAISNPGTDSLFVVDDNLSYNKLNPYIHESATYHVHIDKHLNATATLSLHYFDAPSPRNLLGAGPFLGEGYTKHDYQDFIRVYVPPGVKLTSSSGVARCDPFIPMSSFHVTRHQF